MRPVVRSADSVFAVKTDRLTRTAVRGEAVDFDKYDSEGNLNPHHGWTLDFPESVPPSERTYSNKAKAQGWYDDPENEPAMRGTRWGGTGDYADREFYEKTRPYSQAIDPNREAVMNPSGALGQYGVGEEDLNEEREHGHVPSTDQTGYPESSGWDVRPRSQEHDHEVDHEDYGDDDADEAEEDEDQGSHPVQQHLVNAGFEHRPNKFNGDMYVSTDHNGHQHVVRAPNPRYGAMDTWRYEFQPHNDQGSDYIADGPRDLSFSAQNSEEAYNLHKNVGNDLSELSSRGWGTRLLPENARADMSWTGGGSDHLIEAFRQSANDNGHDRLLRNPQGWHAQHVPDPTPEDHFPSVVPIASSRSRRDVLDAADRFDARNYLDARAPREVDQESGLERWHVPHTNGEGRSTVQIPGEAAHNPRWVVTRRGGDDRIVDQNSHHNWADARDELMGRI